MGVEDLLLEGTGNLERIGCVGEAVSMSGPWRMLRLTRAGRAAAREGTIAAHAARALPTVELLHPTIVADALPGD